jgi:pilus assembly protein Flp/PilA
MLFAPKEKGQGLIEYAIILSLVALIVILVMWLLGPRIGNSYSNISSSVP